MADPSGSEKGKDITTPDPVPPSPSSSTGPRYEEIRTAQNDAIEKEAVDETDPKRPELSRNKSSAATSVTSTRPSVPPPVQKPWYKQPNPLRWGKIPEIPDERRVSPEYKAGFFSALIFQWMSSLMQV